MKGSASKHKATSNGRIQMDEVGLRAEVEARFARAEAEDAAEDAEDAGSGQADPAAEIRNREERLVKMAAALEAVRRETAARRAARREAQAGELRPAEPDRGGRRRVRSGVPARRSQSTSGKRSSPRR